MPITTEEKRFCYLTKQGFQKIKKEYESIKKKILAKKKEGVPRVVDPGYVDSEYLTFWEDMAFLEKRIMEIKYLLDRAVIIKKPESKEVVTLGATVTVENDDNSKERLTIVGTPEADLSHGLISNESLVGKSLLGHRLNEQIKVRDHVYTIKGISCDAMLYN